MRTKKITGGEWKRIFKQRSAFGSLKNAQQTNTACDSKLPDSCVHYLDNHPSIPENKFNLKYKFFIWSFKRMVFHNVLLIMFKTEKN